MKVLSITGLVSIALHLGLLFVPASNSGHLHIPLRRGDPFELTKVSPDRRQKVPSQTGKEGLPVPNSSPSQASGENSLPSTGTGITDGSEFGIRKPPYPDSARLRGEEGNVLVRLLLDEQKALVGYEMVKSSGYRDLDRAGLRQIELDLPKSESKKTAFEHFIQFNFTISKKN